MIRITTHSAPLSATDIQHIVTLYTAIFDHPPVPKVYERLAEQRHLLVLLAYDGDAPVGYKIGYREDPDTFYSWIGGVLPAYRGQGIASALREQQHDWCRANGYRTVRTKTMNRWRTMLITNLRHGFDITGTQTDRNGTVKIIMEKTLDSLPSAQKP
jgi:GNAT superfamily N-acetyltransferase